MKDKTLVILAAGMGSRFGGLKQIEPVGPHGEIIADYSIYDAIRAGFTKVVFVIKEENYDYFKENITSKYGDQIKVEYAFQSLEKIPRDVILPSTRVKMLGTGHALLCAKEYINEEFVMINSDDFYGQSAYKIASEFLSDSTEDYEYMSVNYPFYLATSKNGKVNRGVVTIKDHYVINIDECSITPETDKIIAKSYKTNEEKEISKDQPVSLNFFAFKPSIFKILEREFNDFIHGYLDDNSEFFLTDVIKKSLLNKEIKIKSELSTSSWLGITYKEDLDELKNSLKEMINKGIYPEDLWGDK